MKILNSTYKQTSLIVLSSLLGVAILSSNGVVAEHRHCGESLLDHSVSVQADDIRHLDNQQHSERKTIIGGHIIGSLFSVVNEVDKLGGNAVKLISGSVGKINRLASNKRDLQKNKTSKSEFRDSIENDFETSDAESKALNRKLIEQLLLSGQLELLLASMYALPVNSDISSQQSIDADLAPAIPHHSNSIQCPLRTRSITM